MSTPLATSCQIKKLKCCNSESKTGVSRHYWSIKNSIILFYLWNSNIFEPPFSHMQQVCFLIFSTFLLQHLNCVVFFLSTLTSFCYFDSSHILPLLLEDIYFLSITNPIPLPPKTHEEYALIRKHLSHQVGFENKNNRNVMSCIIHEFSQAFPVPFNSLPAACFLIDSLN